MAAIPIEFDKLFAATPTKPVAADSLGERTNLFRRHLEQRPSASESASASAPQASNSRTPDSGKVSNANANTNQKQAEHKTDSPDEPEKDKQPAKLDDGAAVVATAVASQPVVDADHPEETAAEVKADAESVVATGEKNRAGVSAIGATAVSTANAVTAAKSLAAGKHSGEVTADKAPHQANATVAPEGEIVAHAVAVQVADGTVASAKLSDEIKTKAAAVHARATQESQAKVKGAARTKSGEDKPEPTNEHAAAQGAADGKSPPTDEKQPQDRSHADGRSLPYEPNASSNEPTVKTHAPEAMNVARDGAADVVPADASATRDAIGNAAPQNSPATPIVTDMTATARLPSHLLSRGAERSTSGVHLTDAEQAKFLQRVARAFQAAQERDGEVRLRLSPPELGSLRLEIKIQAGALWARLEAESPAAKSLLLDNLPVLRERLAEQGIRIEHFDVDLTDRQPGSSPQNLPQGNPRDATPVAHASSLVRKATESETSEPATRPPIRRLGDGRLNVIV